MEMKTARKGRKVKGMSEEGLMEVVEKVTGVAVAAEPQVVPVEEPKIKLHNRVIIIGAGGVGFWLGVALSRAGIEYEIWDNDNFEGGLGHTRLPAIENPKTKKTAYLRGFIMTAMGDDAPKAMPTKFVMPATGSAPDPMVEKGDLIVDCSDMGLPTRKKIWEAALEAGARMLRVSYDGTAGGIVTVSEGLPFANKRTGGGYVNVPTLALSLAAGGIGATAVLEALYSSRRLEFQIILGELMRPGEVAA